MSVLLGEKILSMLVACLVGFVIVKGKILKTEDSKVISKLIAYVCCPCTIVSSFLVEVTYDRVTGLALAFLLAVVWHAVVIGVVRILGNAMHLNGIERSSIIYTNAGYLVIPIVYALLGADWVLYTMGFAIVQTVLYWTHCSSMLSETKKINWKKIFLNPNFIAIYVGVFMFVSGREFPTFLQSTISDFANVIGVIAMFVIGMLIGNQDLKALVTEKKIYSICGLRLIVLPLITVVVFVALELVIPHPDVHNILMIVLWAACAPVGTMVTQFAQIYNLDSEYAGKVNLLSVLLCVVTMPMITYIYEMLSSIM